MAIEKQKRDAETVAPNQKTWPLPQGFPVVLGDGKAYFFACASANGPAKALMDKLDQTQSLDEKYSRGDTKVSEYARSMEELAYAALALQYNDETVGALGDIGAISMAHYPEILAAIVGQGPGYDVICKKK